MVITVPRMGNICLAAKAFFEAARIPYVMPEIINKQTLQNGVALSPDEICLPFKIFMGSYTDCIKKGADTILITGSCGPCRFGEYCELQMKLLEKLGTQAKTIVLDAPKEIGRQELLRRIGLISKASPLSAKQKLHALRQAFHILSLADSIDEKAHMLAGYEVNSGECKQLIMACHEQAENCRNPHEIQVLLEKYLQKLGNVKTDMKKKPLRVALIGEIYSMVEPFANLYIEEKLMGYGVSSSRLITPSWWLKDLIAKPLKLNSIDIRRAAHDYLPYNAGGHAKESIGHAVICQRKHFDGAIQIFPLGCMPEIVVKAIMPVVQQEKDFPVLTLVVDEMTGEAGYMTRIEAFLDMLEAKRRKGEISA